MMTEIVLDKGQIEKITGKLEGLKIKDANSILVSTFKTITREAERILKQDVLSGQVLRVRTGRLRSSIGTLVMQSQDGLVGQIGSGVRIGERMPYANIHETGGVIKPKKGRYLAIPLKAALTDSGSQLRGGAFSARDFTDTFFMTSRKGNRLIMQRQAKGAVPLFVLKESVTIPARRYMSKATEQLNIEVEKLIDYSLGKFIEGS